VICLEVDQTSFRLEKINAIWFGAVEAAFSLDLFNVVGFVEGASESCLPDGIVWFVSVLLVSSGVSCPLL